MDMTGRHRVSQPSGTTRRLVGLVAAGGVLASWHAVPQPTAVAEVKPPTVLTQPKPTVVLTQPKLRPERVLKVTGRQGLSSHAVALLNYIDVTYPAVKVVGGVRSDPIPDHPTGRALDIMVGTNSVLGQQVCDDLLAHAGALHIRYLIWSQVLHRPNGSQYLMSDRGSANANHYTHVHVTVY